MPGCASGEWGPAKAVRHFQIHPLTHLQAIFESHHLPIVIKFKCPKQLKFHGKLNSNQHSPTENASGTMLPVNATSALDKFVKYEYDEHDFMITFIIQLPNEGQYGLDIYARDPDYQTEKRTMSHCCKYIINYAKPTLPPVMHESPPASSNTHLYHDYSFDHARTLDQQQQRAISPRINATNGQTDRSLSPRKFILTSEGRGTTVMQPAEYETLRSRSRCSMFAVSR